MNKSKLVLGSRSCILSFLIYFLLAGCTPTVSPSDIYHHKSDYTGSTVAKNLQLQMDDKGSLSAKALSNDSSIPMTMDLGSGNRRYFLDALGSYNIKLVMNKNGGSLTYAGLKFTQDVTVSIWKDGIVEVDKEGVIATDKDGSTWVSKKVKLNDNKVAIIIVKTK